VVRPDDVERAFEESTLVARIRAGVPQGQAKRQHFTPQLLTAILVGARGRSCSSSLAAMWATQPRRLAHVETARRSGPRG
jgi:hypothetical protein